MLTVFAGIRSQYVKLASLMDAYADMASTLDFEIRTIDAMQHFDLELAGQYHDEYGLQFDVALGPHPVAHTPDEVMVDIYRAAFSLLSADEQSAGPVVVFGDANTTVACALAARRLGRDVVHVEAGVRTENFSSVEESNRVVADAVSSLHFASSRIDLLNLLSEGRERTSEYVGDLVRDLVSSEASTLPASIPEIDSVGPYGLLTLHRAENTEDARQLAAIGAAFRARGIPLVFVTHPRGRLALQGVPEAARPAIVIDGLPHRKMLAAVKNATYVVTDSGALQREAYYLGKRSLVRQESVFWKSLTEAGFHHQIEATQSEVEGGIDWINAQVSYPLPVVDDFGNCDSGRRILQGIQSRFY